MLRTIENLRRIYPNATDAELQRYIDLRDEGHSWYAAKVMSGLGDPDDEEEKE